jgi:hypothetical protein
MRAGIQNDLIFSYLPGFRVSPKIVLLARNDSFVESRHSHPGQGKRDFYRDDCASGQVQESTTSHMKRQSHSWLCLCFYHFFLTELSQNPLLPIHLLIEQ